MMASENDDMIEKIMMNVMWAGARLDKLSDLREVLEALVVLRPGHREGGVVLAWWHVRGRGWTEALREIRRTEHRGVLSPLATALAAVCLYALDDPTWHTYACSAAYQTGDPMATRMAQALLATPVPSVHEGSADVSRPATTR